LVGHSMAAPWVAQKSNFGMTVTAAGGTHKVRWWVVLFLTPRICLPLATAVAIKPSHKLCLISLQFKSCLFAVSKLRSSKIMHVCIGNHAEEWWWS
jgi:hypothetical protein